VAGEASAREGLRRRALPAVAAVLTVAAGLSVRSVLGGDLAKYAGDALYALLIFWLVLVVAPRTRAWVAAVVALAVSVAVELFQLTGIPAELGEHTTLARLVLGTTFNAPDLPFYVVGAALGWALHRAARSLGAARAEHRPEREPR
jgi:putative Ca2+/H+ antiporter (TMEM165/GDT1 family)